jgi:hypothetical protein
MRVPVAPENVEVLGYRVKADNPMWAGLDLSRAALRLWKGYGPHLGVPWCHPEDQTGDPEDFDCIYRVCPRAEVGERWKRKIVKSVALVNEDGKWWIDVEFEPKP